MAVQILLNLLIAVIWMLLSNDWSAPRFTVGFLIGALFIGGLNRFWPHDFYLKKAWAVIRLLALFMKELLLSGLAVIRQILRPRLNVRPGIFALETRLQSDWEVTLLACLITLTPGTLTLDVSRDGRILYIHAMDIQDAAQLSEQIKGSFEKAIMEVTR
ncbi:Na+/H+ antiporter subunit E [uncultured Paenibacillus sp.]|uniref:Na+/H+ antiporter subunit E n=1 Tax=uncultured Paenibacillus sp. TaxID=227322 RepID=UPI0028D388D3|nr:Na+/H+ antiporter subunit E [uncultured Paenibacillus sp.]